MQTRVGAGFQIAIAPGSGGFTDLNTKRGVFCAIDRYPMPGDGIGLAAVILEENSVNVAAFFAQPNSFTACKAGSGTGGHEGDAAHSGHFHRLHN
ncbi:MAG: hypothetical protein IJQ61_11325, partial [Bacteroidales bacterium]|nr:hypothetical protein [Bacteroidales bacterium]